MKTDEVSGVVISLACTYFLTIQSLLLRVILGRLASVECPTSDVREKWNAVHPKPKPLLLPSSLSCYTLRLKNSSSMSTGLVEGKGDDARVKKADKVIPKGKKSKGKHEEIKREDTIGLGAPYYWEAK